MKSAGKARYSRTFPASFFSNLRERLPHRTGDDKIRAKAAVKRRLVDDDELVPAVIAHKPRRGIDRERRARDDEHVRLRNVLDGAQKRPFVEPFLIKHHVIGSLMRPPQVQRGTPVEFLI